MEIYATVEGQRLVPVNAHFAEEIETLPKGKPLKIKITKARSLPHNSLYWVCIGAMVKSGANGTRDDIHNATKVKCGLVRMAKMPNGEFFAFPDSTAFDKLDQIAFNDYFRKAVTVWKELTLWDYLPPDLKDKLNTDLFSPIERR